MFRVYQALNKINGKKYIGKESGIRFKRKKDHLKLAKKLNLTNLFHKAIQKYGADAFEWSILEECPSDENALLREMELIKENNTLVPNGYNQLSGGKGSKIWTHDMIMTEALKYTYIRQWFLADCKSYIQAYTSPRFHEYKAHMVNMKERQYTKEEITAVATLHKSKESFHKSHKDYYRDARLQGILNSLFPLEGPRRRDPYKNILCHQNKSIYPAIKDAAADLNLPKRYIAKILRGDIKGSYYSFDELG